MPTNVRLLDLFDIPCADQVDPEKWWRSGAHTTLWHLRVPIGQLMELSGLISMMTPTGRMVSLPAQRVLAKANCSNRLIVGSSDYASSTPGELCAGGLQRWRGLQTVREDTAHGRYGDRPEWQADRTRIKRPQERTEDAVNIC